MMLTFQDSTNIGMKQMKIHIIDLLRRSFFFLRIRTLHGTPMPTVFVKTSNSIGRAFK